MANPNTDKAYSYLRKRILTGVFPPGSPLKPYRLEAEIGVSRTPIRDALRLLEQDGLVVMKPRLGARVTSLTIEEFSHLCGMRLALESYATGLAALNRSDDQLRDLKEALAKLTDTGMRFSGKPEELDILHDYQYQDLQFHIALLAAAQNPLIRAECTRIHLLDHLLSGKLLERYAYYESGSQPLAPEIAEHEAILKAVEKKDAATARAAMERHLQPVVDRSIAALKRDQNYQQSTLRRIEMIEAEACL